MRAAKAGRVPQSGPTHWASAHLQYSPFCGRWRCIWPGSCPCSHPSPRESPKAVESPPPSRLGWGCSLKHKQGKTVIPGVRVRGGGDWPIQSQRYSGCWQGSTRCQAQTSCWSLCLRFPGGSFLCPSLQLAFRLLRRHCRVTGKTHLRAPFFGDSKTAQVRKVNKYFRHAISPSNPGICKLQTMGQIRPMICFHMTFKLKLKMFFTF